MQFSWNTWQCLRKTKTKTAGNILTAVGVERGFEAMASPTVEIVESFGLSLL